MTKFDDLSAFDKEASALGALLAHLAIKDRSDTAGVAMYVTNRDDEDSIVALLVGVASIFSALATISPEVESMIQRVYKQVEPYLQDRDEARNRNLAADFEAAAKVFARIKP